MHKTWTTVKEEGQRVVHGCPHIKNLASLLLRSSEPSGWVTPGYRKVFFSPDVSSNAWVLSRDLKWHLYEVGTLGSAFVVILDMFCMRVLFFS